MTLGVINIEFFMQKIKLFRQIKFLLLIIRNFLLLSLFLGFAATNFWYLYNVYTNMQQFTPSEQNHHLVPVPNFISEQLIFLTVLVVLKFPLNGRKFN